MSQDVKQGVGHYYGEAVWLHDEWVSFLVVEIFRLVRNERRMSSAQVYSHNFGGMTSG